MADRTANLPAQKRNAIAQMFDAAIQAEPDATRKAALGQAKSDLQSSLNGMTGEEAMAECIRVLALMKAI
jgi:hypothetical protein